MEEGRGPYRWAKSQKGWLNDRPTLRLMYVVVGDGQCVGGHASSVYLNVAEGEIEPRWGCRIKTEHRGCCLLDTAASSPPPGHLPYCRTGSYSGRSSPPAYPHEETLHCLGTPESPVHTHTYIYEHIRTRLNALALYHEVQSQRWTWANSLLTPCLSLHFLWRKDLHFYELEWSAFIFKNL